jgi:hypothetical protein
MPAGPYEGQVPVREYKEDRAYEGRMQLIKITVTGREIRWMGDCDFRMR